jgi:hypothetical protein
MEGVLECRKQNAKGPADQGQRAVKEGAEPLLEFARAPSK